LSFTLLAAHSVTTRESSSHTVVSYPILKVATDLQCPVVRVIATDSGARGLNGPAVKDEDAIHAITKRKPHIIISSWMVWP